MRHVKGSHIVVPRVHDEAHAYILQNADNRIVFVIPYQERYSLIGTTDVPVETLRATARSRDDEIDYLLDARQRAISRRPLARADIVWTYSGVRPLYDDGASDPSAVTRDYVLKVDARDGARQRARRCCRSSAARSRPIASSPKHALARADAVLPAR